MILTIWEKIRSQLFYLGGTTIFIVFFYLIVWGENGALQFSRLYNIQKAIAQDNEKILLQNLSYVQEIESLKTLTAIEQKSRSELGMVLPGEIVFVIPEDRNSP